MILLKILVIFCLTMIALDALVVKRIISPLFGAPALGLLVVLWLLSYFGALWSRAP